MDLLSISTKCFESADVIAKNLRELTPVVKNEIDAHSNIRYQIAELKRLSNELKGISE